MQKKREGISPAEVSARFDREDAGAPDGSHHVGDITSTLSPPRRASRLQPTSAVRSNAVRIECISSGF